MQIVKYVDLFIGALINLYFYVYTVKIVFAEKAINNKKKVIFYLVITSIIIAIINIFNKGAFKILLTFPFVAMCYKQVFQLNYEKSILYVICSTLYILVGETMLSVAFTVFNINYAFIYNNVIGTSLGAITVCIFTFPFLFIKSLNKIINNVVINISEKNETILAIPTLIILAALGYKNIVNSSTAIESIMNFIIILSFLLILYLYYVENNKSNNLSKQYNELFKYLEKYENELIEKRKIIHDYKNQLIVINGYIGDNKKLKEYVNELIEEQRLISENSLISNVDKLPKGLKGLIYYKLSFVNKNIKVYLQVLNNLTRFDKLPSKLNKDVLKVIGILLDNAIEGLENENKKNLNIEFSIKNKNFIMIMENTCTSKIDINDIMLTGYSTKGKNRGYGMSLIKDIVKKQDKIDLKVEVIDDEFITKLKVKI